MSDVNDEGQGPSPAEAEAARTGWKPLEEWHGKPEDWEDAESYLRRGRQINAVLNKELKREREAARAIQNELNTLKGTVAEISAFRADLEKKVYNQAMADLRAQLKQARTDGDPAMAANVEEAIDQLKETAPKTTTTAATPAATPATPKVDLPEVKAWKAANPWYTTNEDMSAYADGVTFNTIQAFQRRGEAFTPQDVLAVVDEKVQRMFPQEFGGQKVGMVDGGGSGGGGNSSGGKSAKGFASLPSDVKAQFRRFYAAGYYIDPKTRKPIAEADAQAEYFKDYNS